MIFLTFLILVYTGSFYLLCGSPAEQW